jgi:V/A-type H+-transporting ATPase subunit I
VTKINKEAVKATPHVSDELLSEIESKVKTIETEVVRVQGRLSELERIEEKTSEVSKEIEVLRHELEKIANREGSTLITYQEILEAERNVEEAKTLMGRTRKTYVFEGWIPEDRLDETINIVKRYSENCCAIVNIKAEAAPQHRTIPAPTLLRNPRIAHVYEALTRGYGLPIYNEIDPSIFMLISFPIIFGLMFGDVAHGLFLLLGAMVLYIMKRKKVKVGELINYGVQGSPLLIMCGLSAIVFGFLYNELWGSEEWCIMLKEAIKHITGFEIPFLLSPFQQPTKLLKLSLYIGMAHISFGLILGVINKIIWKEYKEAIAGPVMWLWLYWSGCYLFTMYGSKILSVIFNLQVFGIYVLLPFIAMIGVRAIVLGPVDAFGEALDSFISSISNTISYARIFAFGMIHVAFSRIFLIGGLLGAVAGTFFFLFFEIIFVFFQVLRLHWVEWFLKFYDGTGFPYKPFTIRWVATRIV